MLRIRLRTRRTKRKINSLSSLFRQEVGRAKLLVSSIVILSYFCLVENSLLPYRHLIFNKPFNVVCQFTPGTGAGVGRRTLADFIPVPGVYPAGRLDFDSEGLVLLTSDGGLQHLLTDPKYGHLRRYWVQVEGSATEQAIRELEQGMAIQDYRTQPAKARLLESPGIPDRDPPIRYRKHIPTSWIELELREGRNRQVRRMTAAVGFPTLRLIRVSIGTLTLKSLSTGCWRDLTPVELAALKRRR